MCLVRCHAHDPLGGGAGSYWLARPYNVICSRGRREEVVLIISHICNCMTVWFPFLLFAILSLFKVWLFKFSWLSLNFFVKSLQRPCKVNLIQAGRQQLHLWYSVIRVCTTNSFVAFGPDTSPTSCQFVPGLYCLSFLHLYKFLVAWVIYRQAAKVALG